MKLYALLLALGVAMHVTGSDRVIRERFERGESAFRTGGSARVVRGDAPHVELTGAAADLGLVWFHEPLNPTDSRVAVTFECSISVPAGAPANAVGGGVQMVLVSGEPPRAAGRGGESLGTGGLAAPHVGVAFDLGADLDHALRAPHLEVNVDSDPAVDPPLAASTDVPPAMPGEELRVRIAATLDGRELSVHVDAGDCFRARRVIATTLPASRPAPLFLGFTATSSGVALRQRLHAVTVDVEPRSPAFVRGDCNGDGVICGSVTDLVAIAQSCFLGGAGLACADACDANDDGTVCGSVTDIAYLANFCFAGTGPRPPAPSACGVDPTPDGLDCADSPCDAAGDSRLVFLGENERGFEEYLRTRDEMVMALIPPGAFEQGDHYDDRGGDELPVHAVQISRPFLLGKFEVTCRQYRRFLDAIGCGGLDCDGDDPTWDYTGPDGPTPGHGYDGCHYPEGTRKFAWGLNPSYFEDESMADHPVIWVDWFDAVAYSRWANGERSTDWNDPDAYGLPTEAQWEYAARWRGEGLTPARYPWGGSDGPLDDERNINAGLCNYGQTVGRTVPVCSYPAGRSHFGLYHQAGNVYEWTADWYDADFYDSAPRRDPFVSSGDIFRQLRGGGWFGVPFSVRGAYRCNFPQDEPDIDVGFRCATPAP